MAGTENIKKVREYVSRMPSLPVTVSKVLEVCNNPKTSPIDLDRVIQLDPVLMGRVLKLINSAYYGLGTQVTNLARAIIMLGINTVKNLALSTAVIDRLVDKSSFQALNMDGYWRHSLCVGVTAKLIAKRRGVDPNSLEEYFAAGLLHDIGKIPLNSSLSTEYVRTMSLADRERIPLFLAEKRALDLDHCEAGAIVADCWKLTGAIADAIAHHHTHESYRGDYGDIVRTVAIANYFANREGIGFSGNIYPDKPGAEVYGLLDIEKSLLEELEGPVNAEIEKAKVFLKLGQ
jgi:putative nucleotidyltransferase with HDIG domain